MNPDPERRLGLVHAVLAYGLWGTFPLFWRMLAHVAPLEQFAHRVLWAAVFFLGLQAAQGDLRAWRKVAEPRAAIALAVGATLLGANWYLYIVAVASQRVVEASLGYYLNPLVNVVLGMVFLGERHGRVQLAAFGFAAAGVAVLGWGLGTVPWVALGLALLFGLYGLVRKTSGVAPLVGSAVECSLMAVVGAVAILRAEATGTGWMLSGDLRTIALLVLTGPVTGIPILAFASAARKLPLATLGFVQYLSPTMQLVIAVLWLGEPFGASRATAFAFIWAGVALYAWGVSRGRS